MKKLPWTVYETEKNGITMIVLMMTPIKEQKLKSQKHIGMYNKGMVRKVWTDYKFKYFLPYSSNSAAFRAHLKDLGAIFRPRKFRGGDDCWYCNEWVEELRECATAINTGTVPAFRSEDF